MRGTDPELMSLSGTGVHAALLARRYGFSDVDGCKIEPFGLPDEYRM